MNTSNKYRVEMTNISKSFGIVPVLKGVNLKVKHGEIHALLGENGAGKSTLMKILCGVHTKDKGNIKLDGQKISPRNSHESQQLGISIVYQELSLVNELSVAENIYLHQLSAHKFWINWKQINQDARTLIQSLGFDIPTTEKVKNLSRVQKQVVEIAKALSQDTKVLILDEPTTVFDPKDTQQLFTNLHRLKEQGISIIYISHHLEEIFKIADSITVLKDGALNGSKPIKDIDMNGVIQLMIGRELSELYPVRKVPHNGESILQVSNLSAKETIVKDISFSIKAGEILGIAGLGGSGRTETAKLLFGADKKKSGNILLNGKTITTSSPMMAVKQGIGFVSEDRKEEGVFLDLSVKENISLTNLKAISNKLGFISTKKEQEIVADLINKLNIKASSQEMRVKNLSGGNQQKVALAKWLGRDGKIIIIDEPTRGVDVGAKVEIYQLINQLSETRVGVLVISSDMPEIMGISDRIMVLHEGRIQGILSKEDFSEENILRLAIGGL